jgi:hypothetical protein
MAKPLSPKEEYEKLEKQGYFSSSVPSTAPPPKTGGPTFEQTVTRGAEMTDLYTDVDAERRKQRELEALRVRLNDPALTFEQYTEAQRKIDDLEKGFGPAFAIEYGGATPSFQGEERLLGIPDIGIPFIDIVSPGFNLGAGVASPLPLNVPAPIMSPREIVSDILKPQIVVGPAAQQYAVPRTSIDRAREVFPEALFQESTADKTPEERAEIRDQLEAQRAAFAALADSLGPGFNNEQILEELNADIEEIPKAMRGEGRLGVITQEPEAAGIERIYARQTTPGQVPKLSTAQRAYVQGYYESAYPRFSRDIEKALREQVSAQEIGDVAEGELSEADIAAGGAGAAAKLTMRKRTPAEIETEVARRLPEEIAAAQAPWWATDKREEILANPEKFAVKTPILSEGGGRTVYPTGATREGVGARALRVALAPFNVVVTGLSTGAARLGEELAAIGMTDAERARVPSTVDVAREKRTVGTKAAALPEGFFGDITEAVLMNRGGKQTVEDLYKELGYNEYVGAGLGLALDILVPPMGGVVSGTTRGFRAASAARAARAAGLIEGISPVKAFGQGFGGAFRDAWTWRSVGAVLPGSLKIQAAEDTGRMFALRNELIDATSVAGRALDEDEVMTIVRDFAALNEGGGSLVRRFEDAAEAGTVVDLAADVQKATNQIGRGSTFTGAQKLVKINDEISDGLRSAGFGFASGSQPLSNISAKVLSTVIRNAAARSEKILEALAAMKADVINNPALALTKLYQVDPQAVNRAIGATTAFDAFNQAQKAKGFAEFGDLVLVSNRYIATPDKALEAMKRAAASPTGKFITSILEGKTDVQLAVPTNKMLATNPNRVVQVVSVTPAEAQRIKMIADAYERGGIITKGEADYVRALLGKKQVSIEGLRYLANGNMDLSLAGRAGFDINNIKTVDKFRPTTYALNLPIVGPVPITPRMPFSALTEQAIAKQRIFTPPEMRSVFDGIGSRAASIFTDSKVAGQLLDVPPTTIRAVEDFYSQVGAIDRRISALYDSLRSANPKLRASYGLPQTGKLTDDEVLLAVARGPGGREAGAFVDQIIKQSLIGYKDLAAFDSVWSTRTFFTNAADGSFTTKGAAELAASKAAAVDAMKGGTVPLKQIVQDLRDSLVRITSDPANTTPTYKLSKKLDITADQVPDVIGGAIYLRDVDILKGSISQKLINDDAYATVQNLLPKNIQNIAGRYASIHVDGAYKAVTGRDPIGDIADAALGQAQVGQKTLFQGAVIARQKGYIGADGIMQGMVEHMLQREMGYVDPDIALDMMSALRADGRLIGEVLNKHASVYFQAAEQAIRRAGLSGDSVQDVIDATFALNKGGKLPVTTVSGIQVQDAIDTFLDAQTFQPVLNEIAKNLPKNTPAFQKAVKGLYDLLELVGNVRYNLFLYTRPAYHTTNAVTAPAIIHATLGIENAPGAADFGYAARAMQRGPVGMAVGASGDQIAFVDGIGRPFTYGDIRRLGVDSGIFKTEQQVLFNRGSYEKVIEDAAQMGLNPGAVRKVGSILASMPADVANSTDNFWRMSSFIGAIRRGAPIEVAQEIGKKSLFDYGSLNPVERAFASRLFIFYTFSRLQAENVVKLLGSTNGAARFVRQAAVTRDLQSLTYEYTGGKDYDIRRFYMKDRDLSRLFTVGEKIGLSEYTNFSPSIPSIDSFMQIAALLYARNPIELTFGTQTGGGQFLDPLIKSGIDASSEKPASDAQRRADRLRLMAPEHVAALTNADSMPTASFLFGEMTPLIPSRETSKTYNDKEWQLTPEGYGLYKTMRTMFQIGGIESSLNYWAPIGDVIIPGSEQNIGRPGKSVGLQATGLLSSQERPTLSAQEEAVLRTQRDELQKREKFRADQQQMMELQQLQQGGGQ